MSHPIGTDVTIHRTTRTGHRSWTGTLISSGVMTCGGAEMEHVAIREENGRIQHFAIDPLFTTVVTAA